MQDNIVLNSLLEAQQALTALLNNQETLARIKQAGDLLANTFKQGGSVISCGNGGSMCDAIHFAEECSGRFRADRPALRALALSDPGYLSCVANDYGWNKVFSRGLEAFAKPGDTVLLISTSGASENILEAAKAASQKNLQIISLTGKPNSPLSKLAHIDICTPAGKYSDRIQELHIKILHILVELCENELFGKK